MIGSSAATALGRARAAAGALLNNPVLECIKVHNARSVLVNITASNSRSLNRHEDVMTNIRLFVDPAITAC